LCSFIDEAKEAWVNFRKISKDAVEDIFADDENLPLEEKNN